MKCARCHDVELADGGPLSASTCPRCGGGLVPEPGVLTLLEELKHTLAALKELAAHYGGERLPCPACRSKMSPLVFRAEHVDLCFGCGALWVDRGQLESVTQGRHALPAPTSPPPRRAQTALAAPAQALVRVDERSLARHLGRAVLAGAGAVGVIWSIVGIVPGTSMLVGVAALGAAAGLSRRRAFDVLPRARRMVRWRGWFAPDAKDGEGVPFSPDSCVVVRRARALSRQTPFVVIDLVDAEGRALARLRGPMLALRAYTEAPRYARALGVSVRFDVDPRADDALDAEQQAAPSPAFAGHDLLRVDPDPAAQRTHRLLVRAGVGATLAEVTSEIAARGRPKNLDELLAEHFAMSTGANDGDPAAAAESVRLFSTHQLGARATVLVGREGRTLGHVDARRTLLGDVLAFHGPQGRRSAVAVVRRGAVDARILDGYGRAIGSLGIAPAPQGELRPVVLQLVPGRLTGDARFGILALAVHASLAGAVDAL